MGALRATGGPTMLDVLLRDRDRVIMLDDGRGEGEWDRERDGQVGTTRDVTGGGGCSWDV